MWFICPYSTLVSIRIEFATFCGTVMKLYFCVEQQPNLSLGLVVLRILYYTHPEKSHSRGYAIVCSGLYDGAVG